MDDEKVVVINNGSRTCRAGLAGDDEPRVFPSIVGHHKHHREVCSHSDPKNHGAERLAKKVIPFPGTVDSFILLLG